MSGIGCSSVQIAIDKDTSLHDVVGDIANIAGAAHQILNDLMPSMPVGMATSAWGIYTMLELISEMADQLQLHLREGVE